ncbi:monothiol glutaredoxin-S1-like [Silene latifolia]|uniref:monothiol glutaredoxin-S1-like n=1 Tax=Silene latifolia TaxID=37657 RepID=UPI003D7871DB
METLRPLVDQKPVVIFSRTNTDPITHSMKQLFSSYGANPLVYEMDEIESGAEVGNALEILGHILNLPAIFIGGQFVGGPNEVIGLQVRGQLVQNLINARAIWVWNNNN